VDLSTFIVSVLCLIDDRLKERCIRSRGPAPKLSEALRSSPKLSDAEVITIEIIAEFLGIDTE
jgi:hypothetical protein